MGKPDKRPVHVAEIKKTYKGKVHVSTYLRRTFREDGKVKHETVANISDLPDDLLAVIKQRLASKQPLVSDGGTMTIERSLPHGNVAAVLGTLRNIGLDQVIGARSSRERSLVMAMIVDRMISPGSKLSCSTGMHPDTAQNTLAEELQLGEVEVHELYDAMDWLLERQTRIENKLAKTHLKDGTLAEHTGAMHLKISPQNFMHLEVFEPGWPLLCTLCLFVARKKFCMRGTRNAILASHEKPQKTQRIRT